jgi:hypothetical protein
VPVLDQSREGRLEHVAGELCIPEQPDKKPPQFSAVGVVQFRHYGGVDLPFVGG